MGSKQTKCEGIYLPETPSALKNYKYKAKTPNILLVSEQSFQNVDPKDPRSPNGNRTPITRHAPKQSVPEIVRKHILKVCNYNFNDPRSPSLAVARTPISLDDTGERGFSLDDTFADLLVETHAPTIKEPPVNEQIVADSPSLSFVSVESETQQQQQQLDPRSPTEGVQRTPLVFTEYMDEEQLDDEMEDMLAKMSLDLSSAAEHSLVSLRNESLVMPPTNKHLERLRVPAKPPRLTRTSTPPSAQIYQDCENISPKNLKSQVEDAGGNALKRTPLSCLANKPERKRNMHKMGSKRTNKHALTVLANSQNSIEQIEL